MKVNKLFRNGLPNVSSSSNQGIEGRGVETVGRSVLSGSEAHFYSPTQVASLVGRQTLENRLSPMESFFSKPIGVDSQEASLEEKKRVEESSSSDPEARFYSPTQVVSLLHSHQIFENGLLSAQSFFAEGSGGSIPDTLRRRRTVCFDSICTIQKFNPKKPGYVGQREQRHIDMSNIQENGFENQSKKRKRVEENTCSSDVDHLQQDVFPLEEKSESERNLAAMSLVLLSQSNEMFTPVVVQPTYSQSASEKKELKPVERASKLRKTHPTLLSRSEKTPPPELELRVCLEKAEYIMEKRKNGVSMTRDENEIFLKIVNAKKTFFEAKSIPLGISGFQRMCEKSEQVRRQKVCGEYFQQCRLADNPQILLSSSSSSSDHSVVFSEKQELEKSEMTKGFREK